MERTGAQIFVDTLKQLGVEVMFGIPGGVLVPGMFVRVQVPNEPTDALLVPEIALQRDLEELIGDIENAKTPRDEILLLLAPITALAGLGFLVSIAFDPASDNVFL